MATSVIDSGANMDILSQKGLKIVKTITRDQWLELCHAIVDDLDWNNSESDLETWRKSFTKQNFDIYLAVEKESSRVIGVVTRCDFDIADSRKLSFIGMFYVRPEHRGKCVGKALFEAAMKDCSESVTLYGAPEMWQKYATNSGFSNMPSWKMLFLSVKMSDLDLSSLEDDSQHDPESHSDHTDSEFQIKSWTEVDFDSIFKFDLQVTNGLDRKMYTKAALEQPNTWTMVATDSKNGNVIGFCRAREVIGRHLDMGPFYANSRNVANKLFRLTIESVPDWRSRPKMYFKIPSNNPDTMALVDRVSNGKKKQDTFYVPQFTCEVFEMNTDLVYSIIETDCALI